MNDEPEDIVVRLRSNAETVSHEDWYWLHPLLLEAANEIELLRQQLAHEGYGSK